MRAGVGILYWDDAPEGDCLVSPDGVPVFPVRSRDEMEALYAVEAVMGLTLEWASGQPTEPLTGAGLVVSIGEAAEAEGRLYAHLTRRHHRVAASVAEAFSAETPDVVVTVLEHLTAELLSRCSILPGQESRPTGIVCSSAAGLRRQVLVRAAATYGCGPPVLAQADVLPDLDCGRVEGLHRLTVGKDADRGDVLEALTIGAAVTHVIAHSDGVDAALGALWACPLASDREDDDATRVPRCELNGTCHRLDQPVAEALASGLLLDPRLVAGRVVLWNTCYGVVPRDAFVDHRHGFGLQLVDSPQIGALVTSYSLKLVQLGVTLKFAEALLRGQPVGKVLRKSADDPESHSCGSVCLFGDPRVAAVPQATTPFATIRRAPRPQLHERLIGRDDFGLQSLSMIVAARQRSDAYNRDQLSHIRALASSVFGDEPVNEAAVADAVAEFIATRGFGDWLNDWGAFASGWVSKGVCSRCGEGTEEFLGRLVHGCQRRFRSCGTCDAIYDLSHGAEATIGVDQFGVVAVDGWEPDGPWGARLVVSTTGKQDKLSWPWPIDVDGRPARTCERLGQWPAGPVRVSAVLVAREGISLLTQMAWEPPPPFDAEICLPDPGRSIDGAPAAAGVEGVPDECIEASRRRLLSRLVRPRRA